MATCTWPTTLPSFSTATACRSKEFSSSTTQQSFVDLSTRIRGGGGGGGGVNCEAKVQVLDVTPSPIFFLEVGRKKGGGSNSGAVWKLKHSHQHTNVATCSKMPIHKVTLSSSAHVHTCIHMYR